MNKKLQKQIKAYAGIVGGILASEKSNAQVYFYDFVPDTLVEGINGSPAYFNLDINNDAVPDFRIRANTDTYASSSAFCTGGSVQIMPLDSNKIAEESCLCYSGGGTTGNWLVPAKFISPDTINSNLNFHGQSLINCLYEVYFCNFQSWHGKCGNWHPGNEGCVGFSLKKNGSTYYGWIKIKMVSRGSCKVKEFAYQTQPDVPILACDETNLATGISENNSQFNFTQQNNSVHISAFQKLNRANISVYDLLGKEFLQQPFEGKETTITIHKKGIYFVEVNNEKGIFRKKVFIY
jgi:type IX secretion system substrate protein